MIWDIYGDDERAGVWQAIRQLLPENSPDWSRKGIYGYWDPETRELLYVGLATNLPERFAQHNRLVPHSGGNKADAIDSWFSVHGQLGFTLLIQSAAVQTLDMLHSLNPLLGVESDDISRTAEGQLIELHRLEHGRWPLWNGIGGSTRGAEWARPSGRPVIRLMSAVEESLFVARRTLRILVRDEVALRLEALLHAARMHALVELEFHDLDDNSVDSDSLVEKIVRFLMFRDGKLVDDLANLDEQIHAWVVRLADHRAMAAFREEALTDVRALPAEQDKRDQLAAMFIEMQLMESADEVVARDAADVLATGYIEQRPRLDQL